MSKILKDTEMLEIVRRTIEEDLIDDGDQYIKFLEGLGSMLCDHFGGEPGHASHSMDDDLGWCMSFRWNDSLPPSGGVFAEYDTDIIWTEDGEFESRGEAIKARLESIRESLNNENISYGELAELESLKEHIDPGDVQLLEAAGVPEFPEDEED